MFNWINQDITKLTFHEILDQIKNRCVQKKNKQIFVMMKKVNLEEIK